MPLVQGVELSAYLRRLLELLAFDGGLEFALKKCTGGLSGDAMWHIADMRAPVCACEKFFAYEACERAVAAGASDATLFLDLFPGTSAAGTCLVSVLLLGYAL